MLRSTQSKYAVSISLIALSWLMPELARARVYSYTSLLDHLPGTYASSGTACAGSYRLSITFTTSLSAKALDNLPLTNITADVDDLPL